MVTHKVMFLYRGYDHYQEVAWKDKREGLRKRHARKQHRAKLHKRKT